MILESFPGGRPKQVEMTVKAAGLTDVMVIEYTFTPVSETDPEKTRVKFDMKIDLSIPMPGFLLKRTLKGGMETATDGLRNQVLKVKTGCAAR